MALNWLEEVVSHLYKLRGYIVLENEDLPMPEGVSGRTEADIIAFKDGELVHVECTAWWGQGRQDKKEFQRLNKKFERVRDQIFKRYSFLKQYEPIIKIFVTSTCKRPEKSGPNSPWNRLQNFCNENNIELIQINTIIEDLIRVLRMEYPGPGRVGEKGIAQFLTHLIYNDFLKRPQE